MTDLNSTLADMRARVDHGVYAGQWAIDHLPTVFGLYDAGMAYRDEGTVLLGSAFQPNVASRIVADHNDLPKLLAAVEAAVVFSEQIASDCATDLPCQECATRIELRRVLERALGVSDDPQNQ